MAEQQEAMSDTINVPLVSEVWTSKNTVYNYDRSAGYGTFLGTKNATVFAPQSGTITLLGDGSWIIKCDLAGGVVEWIGVSKLTNFYVKNNEFVAHGKPIGVAAEDFVLSLNQSVNNKSQVLDPVPYLIMCRAAFVNDPKPQPLPQAASLHPRTDAAAPAHLAIQTPAPGGTLATTSDTTPAPDKKPLTNTHLLIAGLAGLGIGGLVAYNMRRR